MGEEDITQEDASKILIGWLQNPDHGSFGSYGYDIYLPHLILTYLRRTLNDEHRAQTTMRLWIPHFYAAAWDLCRRGIIRPGINSYQAQATDTGNAGDGYSFTPFGRNWLSEADKDAFVPTEPERFAAILAKYQSRFGPGFHERAQQAIRCYGAHAYLACCAMCGAAAESIVLALAVEKTKDEATVLATYATASGRSRLEKTILGQAPADLQRDYKAYTTLLKYWRDISGHGKRSDIADNEAFTSLALLLRLATFVNEQWDRLVK